MTSLGLRPRTLVHVALAAVLLPLVLGQDCTGGAGAVPDETNAGIPDDERVAAVEPTVAYTQGYGCDEQGISSLYKERLPAWGDIHSHTSFSNDAIQHNGCVATPTTAIEYAYSIARLDFVAITDHAEDGPPGDSSQARWDEMMAQIKAFQARIDPGDSYSRAIVDVHGDYLGDDRNGNGLPDHDESSSTRRMVVFPGFEYTKCGYSIRLPEGNGHKNIICYSFETSPPRGVGADVLEAAVLDERGNVVLAAGGQLALPTDLWNYLDQSTAEYISIPHHPAKAEDKGTPRIDVRNDWAEAFVDEEIQPLVEVYSRHGSSEMNGADDDLEHVNAFDPEFSAEAALNRWLTTLNPGYKLGFVGGTDTHDGNPGAVAEALAHTDARLGNSAGGLYSGGLTAAWVSSILRPGIWQALKRRNCYATSGARIRLEFTAKLGSELVAMGQTLRHSTGYGTDNAVMVNLHVRAVGDGGAAVVRVQIYRSGSLLYDSDDDVDFLVGSVAHLDYSDVLEADNAYYRVKVWQEKPLGTQALPGNVPYERAWSSPIWVERIQ